MRIRNKISIPFIILAIAGISLTALLSVNLIAEVLEQRFERQLSVASELLSQANFTRNAVVLARIKAIVDADLLTIEEGVAVASTLTPDAEREWLALFERYGRQEAGATPGGLAIRHVALGDRPYTIAYRPLTDGSDAAVVILKESSDIVEARQAVTKPIVIVGILMAVLISLISHLATRSFTSPLQRLARASQRLAAGDWDAMVEIETSDEVGELAAALNEMARELRRSEEKLLHSEKLQVTEHLAARVAHDIRNPLFSIKMRAQMMCERLPEASADRATLEPILKDIEHVEWVVQGLLDLASPVKLHRVEGNVNQVIEDVLVSTGDQLTHARIAVERELDPNLPRFRFDPGRLKQALLNLVLNAAEAMPDGGILAARTGMDEDAGSVVIEILDVGEGIDPMDSDRLFDPFFTTRRDGVGLGLINARSLVESHGGTLELLPRAGGGARAVIRLPIRFEANDREAGAS